MKTKRYFAYGSNLNSVHFRDFCRRNGHGDGCLRKVGAGWLPDHALVFDRFSGSWKGGALSIKELRGAAVRGAFFEVTEAGLAALDAKEGAPRCYKRVSLVALDEAGREVPVFTYQTVREQRDASGFVSPSPEYLKVVKAGYQEHGFASGPLLDAACNIPEKQIINGVFTYGTLLRGEERGHILPPFGLQCALLAETQGQLWDAGAYPAMTCNDSEDSEVVQGEFMRVRRMAEALPVLDEIEGFNGFGHPQNLFRRVLVDAHLLDGRFRRAWTYVWAGRNEPLSPISSGDWREHLGRRGAFVQWLAAAHAEGNEHAIAEVLARWSFVDSADALKRVTESFLPLAKALAEKRISERKIAQVSGKWAVHPEGHFIEA